MNKVILMGRLTRDAEIRYAQGDNSLAIARFSLAVDRRYSKNAEEQSTDFINCVAFGKIAEFFERFGRKGTKFVVEGRIQTGSYTNKDGQKVYTTDVVVENAEFAESKSAASGNAGGFAPADRPAPSQAAGDGFMNIPDGIDEEMFGTAINYEFGDVEETGILIAVDEILEDKRMRHIQTFIESHPDALKMPCEEDEAFTPKVVTPQADCYR